MTVFIKFKQRLKYEM